MTNPKPRPNTEIITDEDVADGLAAVQQTFANTALGETLIVDGYGLVIRVSNGELEIGDGIGQHRRARRIARPDAAAGRIRRILVLGAGTITTDAIAWCHAVGTTLLVAGPRGEPLMIGTPARFDHGGLRRAQALAPSTDTGMAITHWLLGKRLDDQARIARHPLNRPDHADAITRARAALAETATPEEAMVVEMRAAEHYWAAWDDRVHLTFAVNDRRRVPEHWTRFGGRSSPLGEATTNRHAGTPINALLNYGYRLAEIEATTCCQALGLDPALGCAHATGATRPALVLDLIETARGVVEEHVLDLASHRTFRKADYTEMPTGQIRVTAPLSHQLATALLPEVRAVLAPVVEHVTTALAELAPGDLRIPAVLTRARHRARQGTRSRKPVVRPATRTGLWVCPDCGGSVSDPQHVRCNACIDADPRQTPEIRGRRAKAIAARRRTAAAWENAGGNGTFDPEAWPTIQKGLADVKLADITAATGLSKSFASVIRAGKSRPHPSLWPALAAIAQSVRAR